MWLSTSITAGITRVGEAQGLSQDTHGILGSEDRDPLCMHPIFLEKPKVALFSLPPLSLRITWTSVPSFYWLLLNESSLNKFIERIIAFELTKWETEKNNG